MKKKFQIGISLFMLTLMAYAGNSRDDFVLPAEHYGKWGFITKEGQWKIRARFEKAYHFTEGLAAVKYDGRWGYIGHDGSWRIDPGFEEARPFKEGLAGVMSMNKWGYIDKKGQWVIKPAYRAVSSFSDGMALVKSSDGYRFIDQGGHMVITDQFRKALPFADGLAFVVYAGYQGYIDQNGNWLIRHNYEEAYSFSEGRALVKKNGRYGFIDKSGLMVIQPIYEDAGFFREGFAPVKTGGQWGYINRWGKMVIRSRYERAYPFLNGYAIVRHLGSYGMIDRNGNWEINPMYTGLGYYARSTSLEEMTETYVKQALEEWQLKREFEKTEDYLNRISKNNLEEKISQFTEEAVQYYAKEYVRLDEAELGLYDADLERFYVRITGAYPIRLPIPIKYAPAVKAHWKEVTLKDPVYSIHGDRFMIKSLTAVYNGMEFIYSGEKDFNTTNIPVFHVNIPEVQMEMPAISLQTGKYVPDIPPGFSDVDRDIPKNPIINDKTFALIIGNEDYSSYQQDLTDESNVDYAVSDARVFSEYLVNTLGVPVDNITLLINASAGQMRRGLSKMRALAKAYNGDADIIFYYAGHGLPDEETRMPYLIPVDVSGSDLEYAINLEEAYNTLTEYKPGKVTVFLDACFSGGGRNGGLIQSRGVRIKPKSPFVLGNLIVFSATRFDQRAYAYREKAHGMFTYYLLKALQVSKGRITYGELANYIHTNVMRKSILINEKEQEPELFVSPALESEWKALRFLKAAALPVASER